MADITSAMVKELREKTGAGMMDCKKALDETNGDVEAAVDWLRKKGLAAAAKKSGRVAAEGLIGVTTEGSVGAMVELNSETDFVARNDQFQDIVEGLAKAALTNGQDVDTLKASTCPTTGKKVDDLITESIGTIGENLILRRSTRLDAGSGTISAYLHNQVKPGLGKIGVLVALEGDASKAEEVGKQIAMHIAAAKPEALNIEDVDAANLERERQVLKEQAMASGKPAEIAEKMVEGRIRKYYEEVVLVEQVFVIDGKAKVKDILKDAGLKITAFERFTLGEGVEKKEENFAEEVAKAANG